MARLETLDEIYRDCLTRLPTEVPDGNIGVEFCKPRYSDFRARLADVILAQEELYRRVSASFVGREIASKSHL